MRILRDFVRHVIMESADSHGKLAAYAFMSGHQERSAVIYDSGVLSSTVNPIRSLLDAARFRSPTNPAVQGLTSFLSKEIVRGMIVVGSPVDGKCNGAWQVLNSAGPGLGKIVYSVGYALSPTGRLIPDRGSVTDAARSGWDAQATKGRIRQPLDDKKHRHNEPGNEYHTDDPSDDCGVYLRDPRWDPTNLNYSYDSMGDERGILDALMKRHEETMSVRWTEDERRELEAALNVAGLKFFSRHFPKKA